MLCVVLYMSHVCLYHIKAILIHHLFQQMHPVLVGSDLGLDVGEIVGQVAGGGNGRGMRRVRKSGESLLELFFLKHPIFNNSQGANRCSFLSQCC